MLIQSLLALAIVPAALAAPAPPIALPGNPLVGKYFYANPNYATHLEETIKAFNAEGDLLNAARTKTVQRTGTFVWVTTNADVPTIPTHINKALTAQNQSSKPQVVGLVVYNIPDRDCSSGASAGELNLSEDGLNKYKQFIDKVAEELCTEEAKKLDFVIILEPDALANLVTNMDVEMCANAATAYKEGIAYAIQKLQFLNVHLYIDAGHSGWLGWSANLEPAAKLFSEVLTIANTNSSAMIRGFATNVANYNAYIAIPRENFTAASSSWDESHYVNNLAPYLQKEGVPAHFIIDQGRSGRVGIRQQWSQWCNVKGAGFGARPTTMTNDTLVDALVWVKPGGDSDGTSDPASPRFDKMCASPVADVPAPVAGVWFNEYAMTLVKNANPPLDPIYY